MATLLSVCCEEREQKDGMKDREFIYRDDNRDALKHAQCLFFACVSGTHSTGVKCRDSLQGSKVT